jgi:hypothetical protein
MTLTQLLFGWASWFRFKLASNSAAAGLALSEISIQAVSQDSACFGFVVLEILVELDYRSELGRAAAQLRLNHNLNVKHSFGPVGRPVVSSWISNSTAVWIIAQQNTHALSSRPVVLALKILGGIETA